MINRKRYLYQYKTKKPKTIILFAVLTIMILSLISCGSKIGEDNTKYNQGVSIDYPFYKDIHDMVSESDDILLVENIRDTGVQNLSIGKETSHDYHVFECDVVNSNKGQVSKGTFKFKVIAGEQGDEMSNLLSNEAHQAVLFVKIYEDSPASLLNPTQGAIGLNKNESFIYTQTMDQHIHKEEMVLPENMSMSDLGL